MRCKNQLSTLQALGIVQYSRKFCLSIYAYQKSIAILYCLTTASKVYAID
jgi:hypothetical protein